MDDIWAITDINLAVLYFDVAARFQKFTDQLVAKTRLTFYVTSSGHVYHVSCGDLMYHEYHVGI